MARLTGLAAQKLNNLSAMHATPRARRPYLNFGNRNFPPAGCPVRFAICRALVGYSVASTGENVTADLLQGRRAMRPYINDAVKRSVSSNLAKSRSQSVAESGGAKMLSASLTTGSGVLRRS
jgi:hypothetical protein